VTALDQGESVLEAALGGSQSTTQFAVLPGADDDSDPDDGDGDQ
jgi:hypothetical protein